MDKELVRKALELRLQMAKTPPKKYHVFDQLSQFDGRAHGTLLYHGAQPGRWAGRHINPQNLPRGTFSDSDECAELYAHGDLDLVRAIYGSPMDALCTTVRSMIKAEPGCRLIGSDYSAIESRGLAWQAGQRDKIAVYASTGKVYEQQAGKIFGVDPDTIEKSSWQRQIGKVADLALGYQGGYHAFVKMGQGYGIDMEAVAENATDAQRAEFDGIRDFWRDLRGLELTDGECFADLIKRGWRAANANIVQYWDDVLSAALIATDQPDTTVKTHKVAFRLISKAGILLCRLPSGRKIAYSNPERGTNKEFGTPVLKFTGTDDKGNWGRQTTWGGKLVQNITEGICRDLLAHAIVNLESARYPVVLHVHDEVLAEVPNGFGSLEDFNRILCDLPAWAAGLPVKAEGYEAMRYRK